MKKEHVKDFIAVGQSSEYLCFNSFMRPVLNFYYRKEVFNFWSPFYFMHSFC
jgi:hypothetical protein